MPFGVEGLVPLARLELGQGQVLPLGAWWLGPHLAFLLTGVRHPQKHACGCHPRGSGCKC